jgi:hypothetical protein
VTYFLTSTPPSRFQRVNSAAILATSTNTSPLFAETAEASSSESTPDVPVGRTETEEPPTSIVREGPAVPVVDKPAVRTNKRVNFSELEQIERYRRY